MDGYQQLDATPVVNKKASFQEPEAAPLSTTYVSGGGHGGPRSDKTAPPTTINSNAVSSGGAPVLNGEPRRLPNHYLGGGYRNNSFFAARLRNMTFLISLLDCAGIGIFWFTKGIDEGGLHVENVFDSLTFHKTSCPDPTQSCRSCDTVVTYSMLVFHMLPVVLMLGLPASGFRVFEPFKRELRQAGSSSRSKVKRSLFLQACELAGAVVVVFNAVAFMYFVYSFFQGDNFHCNRLRVQMYALGATICFVLIFVQLTYFARFREHIKMQLGAFMEADQTGDIRSKIDQSGSRFRSEHAQYISDIRKKLFKATELGNNKQIATLLTAAQSTLGEDFAQHMYADPSLFLGLFGKSKKNPLHVAAFHGNMRALAMLVDHGFNVNSFDKVSRVRFSTGDLFWYFAQLFVSKPAFSDEESVVSIFKTTLVTPLHCAVLTGQVEAVQWLLDQGAIVNVRSKSSHWSERVPPIFLADNHEIVLLLLEAGANHLEIPDPGRMNTLTVLQLAYLRKNIPVAETLEDWGGDVALTPLHAAAAMNDVAAVRKLLKAKSDPNSLGEHGYIGMHRRTPLHWAAIAGAVDTTKVLLEFGADANFQDVWGRTPLHWASRVNRAAVIEVLLKSGSRVDIPDLHSMTPLLCAAQATNVTKETFDMYELAGAHIDESLPDGTTSLHIAVAAGLKETALSLLASGADIMKTNHNGERPLDCTTSTELQFEIKKAAGSRDVMISYTHSHIEFAEKLRRSLEEANVTTWLDRMDPTGIGGGSVWREEIAKGIKNACLVVCILTEDYSRSEWCIKELALAKEVGTPIMAISTEGVVITEDLQVYLYTRQIVPFEKAITSLNRLTPKTITYEYDEEVYETQFRSLLDGVRDEIEKRRQEQVMRANRRRVSNATGNESFGSMISAWDASALPTDFVFISHGDHHHMFVQRIYRRLTENGITCCLDGAQSHHDMAERIHASKEAILQCSAVIVILSSKTAKSELVRDQLSFAEDKGRTIYPVVLNNLELGNDTCYTLARTGLFHFMLMGYGFEASFASLWATVSQHVKPSSNNSSSFGPGRPSGLALFSGVAHTVAFGRPRKRSHAPAMPRISDSTAI